jgi:uncharacterized membrane protein
MPDTPKKKSHHELHARTFVKAITWKLLATLLAFVTTYHYTGSSEIAGKMAVTTFVAGLIAYYVHERVWNAIHWGKETRE